MCGDYGCRPADILGRLGQGVGPCCFETHVDVPDGLRGGLGVEADPFIHPLSRRGSTRWT